MNQKFHQFSSIMRKDPGKQQQQVELWTEQYNSEQSEKYLIKL